MTTSLNGWSTIDSAASPLLRSVTIPGTHHSIRVRREIAPVIAAALAEVNTHVIALDGGPVDGWVPRNARSTAKPSNHWSGTAVDFRYDVLKADHRRHMTGAQITAMHAILDHYRTSKGKRIFGWGGDWKVNAYCDEMHLEIGQAWEPGVGSFVSAVDVADVAKRLRINVSGVIGVPVKVPAAKPAPAVPAYPGAFTVGAHGPYVLAIQLGLIKAGYRLTPDGAFGAQTKAALMAWQRHNRRRATGGIDVGTYRLLAR